MWNRIPPLLSTKRRTISRPTLSKPHVTTIAFLLGSIVFACGGNDSSTDNNDAGSFAGNGNGTGGAGTRGNTCPDGNYWDITYDLPKSEDDPGVPPADPPPDQNVLTLRDTMMGIGDTNQNVGPGTATIRFENIDGNPGGKAYLLEFEIRTDFTVPPATTNLVATMGHGYETGPCGSSAVGNVEGDDLIWSDFDGTATGTTDPPNMHGFFVDGTITCDGDLCGSFGAPPQGTTPQSGGPFDLRSEPWKLSADASTFFMPLFISQQDLNSTTRLQVYGVEIAKECKSIEACEP